MIYHATLTYRQTKSAHKWSRGGRLETKRSTNNTGVEVTPTGTGGRRHAGLAAAAAAARRVRDGQAASTDTDRQLRHRRHRRREPVALTQHQLLTTTHAAISTNTHAVEMSAGSLLFSRNNRTRARVYDTVNVTGNTSNSLQ